MDFIIDIFNNFTSIPYIAYVISSCCLLCIVRLLVYTARGVKS